MTLAPVTRWDFSANRSSLVVRLRIAVKDSGLCWAYGERRIAALGHEPEQDHSSDPHHAGDNISISTSIDPGSGTFPSQTWQRQL